MVRHATSLKRLAALAALALLELALRALGRLTDRQQHTDDDPWQGDRAREREW